jgi:integrase
MASLPVGCIELPDTKVLKDWMVLRYPHAGTRNTNLRVLKTFARWLVISKYAASNPFLDIPKWKAKAKPVVIYTPEELQALLANVSKGVKTYVTIAAFAGLRRAEIFRLDWKEVNLTRGYITVAVDKAKTQARRLVPISANLRAWLEAIPCKEGLVVDYIPQRPRCPGRMTSCFGVRRQSTITSCPPPVQEEPDSKTESALGSDLRQAFSALSAS